MGVPFLFDPSCISDNNLICYFNGLILIMSNENTGNSQLPDHLFLTSFAVPDGFFASMAAKGSSRSSTWGFGARALANATLCLWPPDNWLGYLFSSPSSPTSLISSLTLASISSYQPSESSNQMQRCHKLSYSETTHNSEIQIQSHADWPEHHLPLFHQ